MALSKLHIYHPNKKKLLFFCTKKNVCWRSRKVEFKLMCDKVFICLLTPSPVYQQHTLCLILWPLLSFSFTSICLLPSALSLCQVSAVFSSFSTNWFRAQSKIRRTEPGRGMEAMLISARACACRCVFVRREGSVWCPAIAVAPPLIAHTSLRSHPLHNALVCGRTYCSNMSLRAEANSTSSNLTRLR